MFKTKLCLSTSTQFKLSTEDQIRLFKKSKFDGFFTMWDEHVAEYKELADELGMLYQSIHAPFGNAANMWQSGEKAEAAVEELLVCVRDCGKIGVPILVVHPYIGFDDGEPTEAGIENFRRVVEEAKKCHVKIAFENVEGEAFLAALMNTFTDDEVVGFCWDTGHELCYNRGKDMMALYGDRLIATHFNDNVGVSDFEGSIFWTDDLHLLPFDGITNWQSVADRLNQHGYQGVLTFELNTMSKPRRHENDKYEKMPIEEYIAECYVRACRLAYMKNGML